MLAWNQIGCLQSTGTWRIATARPAYSSTLSRRFWVWLSHAHIHSAFIICTIVQRSQELLVVHRYQHFFSQWPEWECLYHLLWTVLWVPYIDRYSLQRMLPNDSRDPTIYCGHCNTLLWSETHSLVIPGGAHCVCIRGKGRHIFVVQGVP